MYAIIIFQAHAAVDILHQLDIRDIDLTPTTILEVSLL